MQFNWADLISRQNAVPMSTPPAGYPLPQVVQQQGQWQAPWMNRGWLQMMGQNPHMRDRAGQHMGRNNMGDPMAPVAPAGMQNALASLGAMRGMNFPRRG